MKRTILPRSSGTHKHNLWKAVLLTFLLGTAMSAAAYASGEGETSAETFRHIELDKTDCSLDLTLQYRSEEDNAMHRLENGEVSIYLVANVVSDNGYKYDTSTGQFAGQEAVAGIRDMDADALTSQNYQIAMQLYRITNTTGSPSALSTAEIQNGTVSFAGLRPGLYLVVQSGDTIIPSDAETGDIRIGFTPYLQSIPDAEGNYEVQAFPKPGIEGPPIGEKETETETHKETEPNTKKTETEKETSPPGTPPRGNLPQTGQLWWPVPVLALAGLAFIAFGFIRRSRGSRR